MDLKVTSEIDFGENIRDITVPEKLKTKIRTNVEYIDDAFGGLGMTPSVATLFTGTPGAGKTTMMLKLADALSAAGCAVIYNTAEESAYQVKMTCDRLRISSGFGMGQEQDVSALLDQFDAWVNRPENKGKHPVLFVDSLQTLKDSRWNTGRITSKTAEVALASLTEYAKRTYANIIVIGQVNKSGKMAGSNKLKHMVDCHLELSVEDDENSEFYMARKLFTSKNRFGGAGHLSILRITDSGFNYIARVGNVARQ